VLLLSLAARGRTDYVETETFLLVAPDSGYAATGRPLFLTAILLQRSIFAALRLRGSA